MVWADQLVAGSRLGRGLWDVTTVGIRPSHHHLRPRCMGVQGRSRESFRAATARTVRQQTGTDPTSSIAGPTLLSWAQHLEVMRGHSSLRREPAVLLMYRGVEGYKVAEIALRSLYTQLCLAKRDGSGQRMLRTGSSKLEAACGSHPESQRSMISGPCVVDVSRHAWCSERESCRVRTAAPGPWEQPGRCL